VLYPLAPEDAPEGIGEDPGMLFSLALEGAAELSVPVTLNLFAGARAAESDTGVERWNPDTREWEDVPTAVDEGTGWLSAAIREPGIFRIGQVEPEHRRQATQLGSYPNPFSPDQGDTSIEYEVTQSGRVRLEVFNIIGQSVRLLVDEAMLDVGVWTTSWDGRNDRGALRWPGGVPGAPAGRRPGADPQASAATVARSGRPASHCTDFTLEEGGYHFSMAPSSIFCSSVPSARRRCAKGPSKGSRDFIHAVW